MDIDRLCPKSIFNSAETISNAIVPSLHFSTDYLIYWRIYPDGSIAFFSNHEQIREYIWLENHYKKVPWLINLNKLANVSSLQQLSQEDDFSQKFINGFGVKDSLILIKPSVSYIESFILASRYEPIRLKDRYMINLVRKTTDQIIHAHDLNNKEFKPIFFQVYESYIGTRVIDTISEIALRYNNGLNQLNEKELTFIIYLISGKKISEYARLNDVSIKTAYKRLEMIKEKLGFTKLSEIIIFFLGNILIKSMTVNDDDDFSRNVNILKSYANGLSVSEIAKLYNLSPRTIESIVYKFKKQYQIDSKAQISILMSYI